MTRWRHFQRKLRRISFQLAASVPVFFYLSGTILMPFGRRFHRNRAVQFASSKRAIRSKL